MSFDPDIFGGLFGPTARARADDAIRRPAAPAPKPARPLPQIRGRRDDGVLWVRAEDVADALESQAPKVNARLIAKLRGPR